MEPISININGYDTCFTECKDSAGNYLLIAIPSNAGKDISEICGTIINCFNACPPISALTGGFSFIVHVKQDLVISLTIWLYAPILYIQGTGMPEYTQKGVLCNDRL